MGSSSEMQEMDCCDNETIVVDGQDDLKLSFDELSIDQQLFIISFATTYINLFEGLEEQIVLP